MITRLIIIIVLLNFSLFQSTKTGEKIKEIHGPFNDEDYETMKKESENIFSFLINNENFLNLTNNNHTNIFEKEREKFLSQFQDHNDTFICKTCLWTFTKFHNLLEKKYGLFIINELLSVFCSTFLNYKVCKDAIDLYAPTVIDSLIEHYLDAEVICSITKICKNSHFITLNADDYAKELLKDKPTKVNEILPLEGNTIKILHVTDIHTDTLYFEVILNYFIF
jgi:Fe-S cluster biosynthesis and repair protein YggX